MKNLIILFAIVSVCFAQTKNIVPRAAHQGQIGTVAKPWQRVNTDTLYCLIYMTHDTTGHGAKRDLTNHDTTGLGNSDHWNTAYSWGDWSAGIYSWAKAATKPTYTYSEVGADAVGAASAVQDNLATHTSLTGTSVHGLGTASTHAATDFDASGAASTVQSNLTIHQNLTTSAHGGIVASTDSRLTDSRNAADVYAWAKNATKPTYTYSEVGALASGGTAADVNVSGTNIAAALSGKLGTSATAADVNVSGTNIAAALSAKEATANKGAASGYCGLDGSSKVAIGNIPTGTTSSTVTIGNDSRVTGAEQTSNKGTASGYCGLDASSKVAFSNMQVATAQYRFIVSGGSPYTPAWSAGSMNIPSGGGFALSGAYVATFTATGTTGLTLPTGGTLQTCNTASALTAGATVTLTPVTGTNVWTLNVGTNATITLNSGTIPSTCVGQIFNLVVTTTTTSCVITFGTNFKSQGTLTTGTTASKTFHLHYNIVTTSQIDEMGRTTAM
jgi:hypothetical protein